MVEQGSEEWLAMRLGVATASRFKDALAKGAGKTRKSYMMQLAAESVTGASVASFKSDAMQWGNDTEPKAREAYEFTSDNAVELIDFVKHDSINAGCSPDGLVGNDGLVEFKCPNTITQLETFLSGEMPKHHIPQVQGQLWITGREWCDFVSFDPRIQGQSFLFTKRIERDDEYIKNLESEMVKFCDELSELIDLIT